MQPLVIDTQGRQFACFPAAVLVFIVDAEERLLLFSPPEHPGAWGIVKGGIEAGETVLEAALRETCEEAGAGVRVRPLGIVHADTFAHDANVPHALGLFYLVAYEGGLVQPGDDMLGSSFKWWSLDDLREQDVSLYAPREMWIVERAISLYRLYSTL